MAARGPQNGQRGLESGLPLGFWALPSSFFDLSTPSMRKVDDGEKKEKENIGERSSPLTLLPVNRLNSDRRQRQRSCQLETKVAPLCY